MKARPSVLVTGAAGYVGRLTVRALAERADDLGPIVGLDLARPQPPPAGVTWVTGDLRTLDLEGLLRDREIDVVIHLASVLRPPPDQPNLAYEVDVLGTRRLLDACLAAGAKKLVVTTSGAAYGYHPDNPPLLTEDDPVRGNAEFGYAHHKRLVEEMLADARREHPELAQLVFRPGTIVGRDVDSPVTALFDQPAILGVWGSSSPFVFVRDADVVACLLKGVLEEKTGTYNLAGDGALTPRELARRLGKPYLPVPAPLLAAGLAVARRLGMSPHGPETVNFLRYRPVLDNRRLKEEFGYVPSMTSAGAFEEFVAGRRARA